MSRKITVERVSKSYEVGDDSLHVLDDVSVTVEPGEFVVVVGPSGCGKTTLLNLLDGLVEPTSGTIEIGGSVVTGPREDVGMVFQSAELLPWRTVRDNVAMGLEIQGVAQPERDDRADEWIGRVGLSGFEDRYPSELSGGMEQRVGLARALAVEPNVLLLDEPFGSLDALTKDRMQTELLQLWERQRSTAVFITHDIDEAIFLADRLLVMSGKPANVVAEIDVDFERPRWNRRLAVEADQRFDRLVERLRNELGLPSGGELERGCRDVP